MTSDVVVVGAGGHAKVCIELLREMGYQVVRCVGGAGDPETCLGVPVLRGDHHLQSLYDEGYRYAFVAVGSNSLRQSLGASTRAMGYELMNAVSPRAVVSPSVRIGCGVAVMAGAVINAATQIDDLAIVNTGATVDHDCVLGTAVHIAPQCGLAGSVVVGDGTMLGIGSRVVPGVKIGARATVGAGAVVIEDVPDGTTVVGVPARPRV